MNKKLFLLFFISALIAFLPISCDIKNPIEGINVKIKNIPRTTTVRIQFIETNTANVVLSPLSIKFSGKDKNNIISDVNAPISELNVKEGIAYFAIKDNLQPSVSNPVEFTIVVQGNGYLSTSQNIVITKNGSNNFVIKVLKLSGTLPPGINSQVQSFGNIPSTGTTSSISANSGGTISTSITIPLGTVLKSSSGAPLSGPLTTEITHFDATKRSSITSFPGGFTVNAQGSGVGGFVTAGFASINMKVGNTPVEQFSQPVSIQIGINPNTFNPTTNTNVRIGDVIPLWSYDENNGTWKFEGNYTVNSKIGTSGHQELYIKKDDVTHLSWYNLDWFFNSCNLSAAFNITGGCWQNLFWILEYTNGQGYLGSGFVYSFDPEIRFFNAPENIPVKLSLFTSISDFYNYYYYNNQSNIIGSVTVQNLCEPNQTYNVQVNTPGGGQNINFTVRGICPNGNVIEQGTLDLEMFKDGYWQFVGRIINGQISLNCLNVGQTYQFRIFYDGVYYTHSQTITSTNMLVEFQLNSGNQLCN